MKTSVKEVITPAAVIKMMELDFIEKKSGKEVYSQDGLKFLRKTKAGIHKTEDGHYEIPLPFKEDAPKMGNLPLDRPIQKLVLLVEGLED